LGPRLRACWRLAVGIHDFLLSSYGLTRVPRPPKSTRPCQVVVLLTIRRLTMCIREPQEVGKTHPPHLNPSPASDPYSGSSRLPTCGCPRRVPWHCTGASLCTHQPGGRLKVGWWVPKDEQSRLG